MKKQSVLLIAIIVLIASGCQNKNTAAPDTQEKPPVNEEQNTPEKPQNPEPKQEMKVVENEAFKITSPIPEQTVDGSFILEGQARVFEASFQYRLEDGHNVLAEGHIMADAGAPEWGNFKVEITYTGATSPHAVLTIFEGSPKDGSPQHELHIPLTIQTYE
ncbi:Gmad2 immunoglobulin-like domain-containing protein [Bacillus sp. 165]|uniref:Gmad2 immunoglobulin-like domain-containing protein n=1 Tax=Bacillus sp. 165 TaxID=1529117 RepID=UPI001ADC994B|nr:Gmad2 immunoglobulin-like domain-containing protein [Bacillus sp. 165]MBO9128965.1 Gmad2 immunoglobulin-like domain-containing protein [Bacillus sp. 165]